MSLGLLQPISRNLWNMPSAFLEGLIGGDEMGNIGRTTRGSPIYFTWPSTRSEGSGRYRASHAGNAAFPAADWHVRRCVLNRGFNLFVLLSSIFDGLIMRAAETAN